MTAIPVDGLKPGKRTSELWYMALTTLIVSVILPILVGLGYLTPEQGGALGNAAAEVITAVAALIAILVPIILPVFYARYRTQLKVAQIQAANK
jgi:fumarate reductase subunit D